MEIEMEREFINFKKKIKVIKASGARENFIKTFYSNFKLIKRWMYGTKSGWVISTQTSNYMDRVSLSFMTF